VQAAGSLLPLSWAKALEKNASTASPLQSVIAFITSYLPNPEDCAARAVATDRPTPGGPIEVHYKLSPDRE
jgi:hypothetical protein